MTSLDQVGKDLHLPIHCGQVWQQLKNQPCFIDDYRGAPAIGRVGEVAFISGLRHAIGYSDGPLFIENNWEWKALLPDPSAGRFLIPVVDSKNQDILFHEFRIIVTVPVTVASSIASARR